MVKKLIRCKVYPKNLRDVYTSSPRVLLKELVGIDRNYLWCGDKKLLQYIDKHRIRNPLYIEFQANTYTYINSKLENKIGLNNISHIKVNNIERRTNV